MPCRPTATAPLAAALLIAASLLAGCANQPPPPPTPATSPLPPLGGGHAVVDCIIGSDGVVRDCHTRLSRGGPQFAASVLAWLTGPNAARYEPAQRHGAAAPEAHRWDIYFSPP